MRKAVRAIIIKDNALLVMHRNKFGRQYCALIGGGIDFGETPEQALYREVQEESSIAIKNHRLVIVEDAGAMYGLQYIYLCEYVSGEPVLSPESEEAKIHALGQNLYQPMWLPLTDLPQANLLPPELKQVLLERLPSNFPIEPIQLKVSEELV